VDLINFYRLKSEEVDFNLDDGFKFIVGFMENFGIRFEKHGEDVFLHILDI
jgi:hypothetical protein